MNCKFCGRLCKDTFCNLYCESKLIEFNSKPFQVFESYLLAAKYFYLDSRTIKKYENIKYSIKRKIKSQNCIDCNINYPKKELTRNNRCKKCISENKHKISQGTKISIKYKGSGNPNYIDGKSVNRNLIRGKNKYKQFVKDNKKNYCEITGFKNNLELHHIIPISLFPEYTYSKWNVITLCSNLHYEIHKQKLDIYFIKNIKHNIKESFIESLNIKVNESIKIDHFDFLKVIVKNYNKHLTKEEIEKASLVLKGEGEFDELFEI
jgi:5-methylcytosine-specific restriction endonuclease McrA